MALERIGAPEPSAAVRDRVEAAQAFRHERLGGWKGPSMALEERSSLTGEGRALLRQALVRDSLSGRAYVRVIRLARTIADLDNLFLVGPEHVAEALSLRLDHRRLGFI